MSGNNISQNAHEDPHKQSFHTWHLGDPFGEQRLSTETGSYIAKTPAAYLFISGNERYTWLNALLTQNVLQLNSHTQKQSLILDSHGHILHQIWLSDYEDKILVRYNETDKEHLLKYLQAMVFWSHVNIMETDDFQEIIRITPSSENSLDNHQNGHTVSVACRMLHLGSITVQFDTVRKADRGIYLTQMATPEVGMWAYHALRIAAVHPDTVYDADHKTLPQEFSLIGTKELDYNDGAVHISKGCYRGQETVSRIYNMGKPPRRLVLFHCDSSESSYSAHLLAPQLAITDDTGKNVGSLCSWIDHYQYGRIAIGLLPERFFTTQNFYIDGILARLDAEALPRSTHRGAGKQARELLREKLKSEKRHF